MAKNLSESQWAAALLGRLGVKPTNSNMRAVVGWVRAEGGHYHNDAKFNPLNTTQPEPGAGNTGTQGNIKVYRDWQQGLDATVKTLRNGRYGGILQALKGDDPNAVAKAIDASPWGTHNNLEQIIAGVPKNLGGTRPLSSVVREASVPADGPQAPSDATSVVPSVPSIAPVVQSSGAPDFGFSARASLALPKGYTPMASDWQPQTRLGQAVQSGIQAPDPNATDAVAEALVGKEKSRGLKPGVGAESALAWATSKIGFKETGENSGGLASYLNERFGFSNAPWCAMFTSAAVTKGGAPASARTASVAQVRAKAQAGVGYQRGFVKPQEARPGDLILFGNAHIGMVQRVAGDRIHYVGGNQSNGVNPATAPLRGATIVRPKYGARK